MPSQCGQDLFVLDVLEAKCNGFFLDSGASDGVRASNTQLLETSFGWKGICVEPNQKAFAALVKNRRCRCVNCCLYDRDATVEFLEDANMLGGILDEYHPAHLEYARKTFHIPEYASGQPITVRKPARAVRSVLRECGAPPVIDYWSLDTEGSELAILKSFPFNEYAFRILTVEHNWLPVREEIRALLESHGYRRIKALAMDDCYVKRGNTHRSSWRSSAWTRASNRRR